MCPPTQGGSVTDERQGESRKREGVKCGKCGESVEKGEKGSLSSLMQGRKWLMSLIIAA